MCLWKVQDKHWCLSFQSHVPVVAPFALALPRLVPNVSMAAWGGVGWLDLAHRQKYMIFALLECFEDSCIV